jgi:uncharacterized membrane protein YczE
VPPTGPSRRGRVRPVEAAVRLLAGLAMCGTGVALLERSGLGLGPWDVLHQGLAVRTDQPIGRMVILVGAVVLLGWLPLRQRPGLGTVANALVIGLTVDAVLAVVAAPDELAIRVAYATASVPLMGIGSGLYLGVDLGPGPRDGIMTGLASRGVPVGLARTGIELSALAAGWLLGGTVGIGTVWFALGVGPAVSVALPRLRASWHPDRAGTSGGPAPS